MIYLNTLCYAAIFIACLAHLNRIHKMPLARVLAFGLVTSGAAGCGIELWLPYAHRDSIWWHLMFNAGVAMMAIFYFGLDRRRRPDCTPLPPDCPFERRFTRVQ